MTAYSKNFKPRRTWYNIEMSRTKAEVLKKYLKNFGIYFEPSEVYYQIHFEILMTELEASRVNEFIERTLDG